MAKVGAVRERPIRAFALALLTVGVSAQQPTNDLPNPYTTVEHHFKMPEGRQWGATSAVDVDKDGRSIWVGERCGANTCLGSTLDPILKFDASGKLLQSFGAGTMIFPHGFHIDRDGNVWITDGQDNKPRRARGAPPDSPLPPAPAKLIGHQVFKYSPDGKLLMTLGTAGGGRDADYFYQPNDVLVAPNGEHFCLGGTFVGRRLQRADHQVRQDRQIHQVVRQARQRTGRVRSAARAGDGFEGAPLRRR